MGCFGALVTGGKTGREVEHRGLKLEKWCTRKRNAASQGTERGGEGEETEERRGGDALEYSSIIVVIENNFKYPQIKASFHGRRPAQGPR